MEFLNRAWTQVTELFRSMSPGARITSGLLLAVVVISVAYLLRSDLGAPDLYLFGGREFADRELDAMQAAFSKAELNDAERVGGRIRVPRRQQFQYIAALAKDNALPEDFDTAIDAVLENASMFESRQLRDLRYRHAMQKKAGMIISAMAGIENATVQYDEVGQGGFVAKKEKTAVVAVRAAGRKPLDEEMIRAVRATVSKYFAGLSPENVTVTDINAGRAYTGNHNSPLGGDNIYATTKRLFEKQWQEKIYNRLAMYPGAVVEVNVELDPEVNHEASKISYDPQPTAINSTNYAKTTEAGPAEGGRPGAVPNLVLGNTPRSVSTRADNKSKAEETREEQQSITGHEQVVRQRAPLVPTRVSASIGIPKSYFFKVWEQDHPVAAGQAPPTPDPTELARIEIEFQKKIEEAVIGLLPAAEAGADPYPRVKVTSFNDFSPAATPDTALAMTGLAWLNDNWQTLALIAVGVLSLVMLRGVLRGIPSAPLATSQPALASASETLTPMRAEPDEAERVIRRRPSSGPSLRTELTAIVREDPDAAANVLRAWIGDAA